MLRWTFVLVKRRGGLHEQPSLWLVCVQVLVATSTLAWGVNTPAHLVIIKGTEFFDAPTRCCTSTLHGPADSQGHFQVACAGT